MIGVVGDVNIDVVPDPIPDKLTIKKDGQHFVENVEYRRGGQGANVAATLAEMGLDVSFFGLVGDDWQGSFLQSSMTESGVEWEVEERDDIDTGTTVVAPWSSGERFYVSHTENNSELRMDDIPLERVKELDHLARRGIWFAEDMLLEGENRDLLKFAQEHGVETSIDLHWDTYWNNGADDEYVQKRKNAFLNTLEYADYVMGNGEEFCKVTGKAKLDDAIDVIQNHNPGIIIVIHQGADGSRIVEGETDIHIGTQRVENPQNPTGAGDTYDAGFLHARHEGCSLREAGEQATNLALDHIQ